MSVSRRFVLLAAHALGLSALATWVVAAKSRETMLRLCAVMEPPQSARVIGLAYLARFPDEAKPFTLMHLIVFGARLSEATVKALGERQLRAVLAIQLRADFADGHMTNLGGGLLSRTEVRLCALSALSHPG